MPNIGRYYVPQFRLATLIPIAKQIFDKFPSEEADSDMLARLLGYASRESGTFYTRMKDLVSYGLLVQSSRGKFRVTELAKRLTYPRTKEEGDLAMKDAFMNVEFWKALYDSHKDKLPSDNFWVDVSQIARVDAPKAKEVEDMIRNAYLDDITKIPTSVLSEEQRSFIQPDASGSKNMEWSANTGGTTLTDSTTIEIPFGKYAIKIPVDEAEKDLAKAWARLKKHMDWYVQEETTNRLEQRTTADSNPPSDQLQ